MRFPADFLIMRIEAVMLGVIAALCAVPGLAAQGGAQDATPVVIELKHVFVDGRPANAHELGQVLIVRGEDAVPATLGMRLKPDDIIATGASVVVITFNGAETEMIVDQAAQVTVLNPDVSVEEGWILVKLKTLGERVAGLVERYRFRAETEYGTAGARGTIFDVMVADNEAVVSVFEGIITIEPTAAGTEPVDIMRGQQAILTRDDPPVIRRIERRVYESTVSRVRAIEYAIAALVATMDDAGSHTGRRMPDYSSAEQECPPRGDASGGIAGAIAGIGGTSDEASSGPCPPAGGPAHGEDTRRKLVQEVQRLLLALSYDPGPLNGQETEQTTRAVVRFKTERAIAGPPRIDEPLLEALRVAKRERDAARPAAAVDESEAPGLPTPAGGKVYDRGTMTVYALIDCIRHMQTIQAIDVELREARREFDRGRQALAETKRELDTARASLDTRDQSAVDRYNERLSVYKRSVDAHNEQRLPAFNQLQQTIDERQRREIEEWNARYEGRQYYRDDMATARDTLALDYFPDNRCAR